MSAEPAAVRWTHVACALCGADAPRERLVDRVRRGGQTYAFHVVACGRCGFVYVTPRATGAVFDNLAGGGARIDAATANRPIYVRALARMRRAGLAHGARVLDLGCARGDFLVFAAEAGLDAVGVDLNPALAEAARARGLTVHTGDVRELDLGPAFDAVTMWDVIEHVDDPVAVLAACRAVLRPGGLVLAHTGNARFQLPKARVLAALRPEGSPFLVPYQHVSHFEPRSIRRAMRTAGLAPEDVFFAGTLDYPEPGKRRAMRLLNAVAELPSRVGGPLLTSAMAALGRRPLAG